MSTNLAAPDRSLTIFPFDGEAFSISLPLVLGRVAFTGDGKTMYGSTARNFRSAAQPDPLAPALYKIEFNPIRASAVSGSVGLRPIYSLAVSYSGDRIVVASGIKERIGCGIFELSPADGSIRELIFDEHCQPTDLLSQWGYLNLSPDGKHATAYRRHVLEMIDLANGSIRSLGDRFMEAAWSPDGKWIAGLEAAWTGRTILLDPVTLKDKGTLPQSQCQWSPDSRYILRDRGGTLETIEVSTGREKIISSSRNRVSEVTTAWVSNQIKP